MWNLVPQPGIATSSPALQGRFLITAPSGKSLAGLFVWFFTLEIWSLDLEKDCLLQGQSSCFGFQLLNLQLICPAFFLFLRCLGLRFNLFPSILTCFFFFFGHTAWLAGSYLPDQGLNPRQQCKLQVLTTGLPGNFQELAHISMSYFSFCHCSGRWLWLPLFYAEELEVQKYMK